MSRTLRKDKKGNVFKEGNPLKDLNVRYKCRCEYCTNEDRRKIRNKVSKREIEEALILRCGQVRLRHSPDKGTIRRFKSYYLNKRAFTAFNFKREPPCKM